MRQGDRIIYYSPKLCVDSKESYQKFTALGTIADENVSSRDISGVLFHSAQCVTRLRENARLSLQKRIVNGKNMRQNCALDILKSRLAFLDFWRNI